MVLYPRDEKHPVTKAKSGILNDTPKVRYIFIQENQKVDTSATVNALPKLIKRVKPVSQVMLDSFRKVNAYKTLRTEWAQQKTEGKRLKKEREAAEKK